MFLVGDGRLPRLPLRSLECLLGSSPLLVSVYGMGLVRSSSFLVVLTDCLLLDLLLLLLGVSFPSFTNPPCVLRGVSGLNGRSLRLLFPPSVFLVSWRTLPLRL